MQAIADWLEKLGMSEYAQRFAENDIGRHLRRNKEEFRLENSKTIPRERADLPV